MQKCFSMVEQVDLFDLTGRLVFITGAGSSGPGYSNGRAIAILLARRGASVIALDLHRDRAEETCEEIVREGGRAEVVVGDVTSSESLNEVFAELTAQGRQPDLLVNNAGGSAQGDCITMDEETWDRQIDFNLKSAFLVTRGLLGGMVSRGSGAIVNIGSVAGVRGAGDTLAYSTAKAGIIQFSRQVALRHAAQGIRCNTVVPGVMHTPLVESRLVAQRGSGDAEAFIRMRNESVPMGRMGDAWDVAHAVLYLLSDAAAYVTGTTLLVDGGASLVTYR